VRISKTDSVGVTVLMSQLTLKSIEGKLKPTPLEFRRTTLPLRLGNLKGFKADSIHFRKFLLNFDIGMTSSVKIGFKGTVTGRNAARRDSIKIPYKVIGGGSISRVDLSSADLDHFINSFLDAPPDTLYFDYDAVINPNPSPNDPSVSIANTDYVFGESNVAARLNVGIAGGRLTDTSDVNIQQSNKQQLEAISSAAIILTIENGMPAQLQYTGKLYDGAGKFLLDLPPKHSPNPSAFTINAAKVNAQGNVIASTTDSITISLTGDEIQKFLESKKMVSSVVINTTSPGAEPVLFKTDQFIKMYGAGKLIYRVNK
jgi:hypothetical protein